MADYDPVLWTKSIGSNHPKLPGNAGDSDRSWKIMHMLQPPETTASRLCFVGRD